ncbi:MAG: DUF447 domain-containing protein [Halobacteriota archaeon]
MVDTRGWPVELRGVTESVVATLGPNDRWNFAALGLCVSDDERRADDERRSDADGARERIVTAKTWGNTRTRRNFHREGGGVVQFTNDPREFVEAALTVYERDAPVLDGADAWAEVTATYLDGGTEGGTRWERWQLTPVESEVRRRRVPTINRGFGAVVDATVAASRLDVDAYDTSTLLDRLVYFDETVGACGGPAEREAFERLCELTGWRTRRPE